MMKAVKLDEVCSETGHCNDEVWDKSSICTVFGFIKFYSEVKIDKLFALGYNELWKLKAFCYIPYNHKCSLVLTLNNLKIFYSNYVQ